MTTDLSERIGLQVTLLENDRLEFGNDVDLDKISERKFSDLAVVAADAGLNISDEAAYYMYRNVHLLGDEQLLVDNHLRFDLTVIPAAALGEEPIKTSGHYHPIKEGTQTEYPELYYVVSGVATYLMQKHDQDGVISDVILARVPAGTAIMMPPQYGHVTINAESETLVMANWVCADFTSVYGDYEQKRGGAYYVKKSEILNSKSETSTNVQIIKNSKYDAVAELREAVSVPLCLTDLKDAPIYNYKERPDLLELLAKPEAHESDFELEKLFKFG